LVVKQNCTTSKLIECAKDNLVFNYNLNEVLVLDEKFMRLAIEKTWEGIKKGQEPFGACIVKGSEVVSLSHNTVKADVDVTAHAEMNAIREACRKLGTSDLSGCEIYATFKPCIMCYTACKRANISRIYYGVGPEDIGVSSRDDNISISGGVLKKECLELVKDRY
jgi:tRNA(Arg) A34 adenosine deaminase TadA